MLFRTVDGEEVELLKPADIAALIDLSAIIERDTVVTIMSRADALRLFCSE
jgi:hypothetical protein